MALIVGGTIDISGNFVDVVRATNYAPEAGVGVGTTTTDGETRYIAECGFASAPGERIDLGTIPFAASYTWAVRFIARATTGTGNYCSLLSRGGTFENNTQGVLGFRDQAPGGSNAVLTFLYARDNITYYGYESNERTLTTGNIYTLVGRWQSGTQQIVLCYPNIGGAGVNWDVVGPGSTGLNGTDGSQKLWLGGPNTFTDQDRSGNAGILGALVYDEYVSDGTLDSIAADFYAQLPIVAPKPGVPSTLSRFGPTPTVLSSGGASPCIIQ